MSTSTSNEENDCCTPPDLRCEALNVMESLLPENSKEKYLIAYQNFTKWQNSKNTQSFYLLNTKMDDPFVSCPYEKTHRVPRSRLQAHIVKCMKHYPKLHICPYNATHRLPEDQIKNHVTECPAKVGLVPEKYSQNKIIPISKTCSISRKENNAVTDSNDEWDD